MSALERRSNGRGMPLLRSYDNEADWLAAATARIAEALSAELEATPVARLLLSGGSTPAPIYRALSRAPLEWSRITVALVDERWLPAGDLASNGRLVKDTLLNGAAAIARFEPMLDDASNLQEAVARANDAAVPATVAVFGMGPDGHTASLFPGMRGLADALASENDYVAVDASGRDGAQHWPQRISLTPAGIARAAARLLLIRGEHKLALLQTAMSGDDVEELPVRALCSAPGAPLEVYWCP